MAFSLKYEDKRSFFHTENIYRMGCHQGFLLVPTLSSDFTILIPFTWVHSFYIEQIQYRQGGSTNNSQNYIPNS